MWLNVFASVCISVRYLLLLVADTIYFLRKLEDWQLVGALVRAHILPLTNEDVKSNNFVAKLEENR
jgi:hypothetical protein